MKHNKVIESPVTAFRKKLGITRAELARRSGVCYVTLSNIENGYVLSVSKSVQKKLANIGAPDGLAERYHDWRANMVKRLPEKETQEHQELQT